MEMYCNNDANSFKKNNDANFDSMNYLNFRSLFTRLTSLHQVSFFP